MKKSLLIVAPWKDENSFRKLQKEVESALEIEGVFTYLFWVRKSQNKPELLFQENGVYCLSNKSYSLFGRLRDDKLKDLLKKDGSTALLVAFEEPMPFLKRLLKNTNLPTIGMSKENLPNFDISISETELKDGKFFKQLNNYLSKIKW